MHRIYIGESSLDDSSAQEFPYNIFPYCSICRVDCKFARNRKKSEVRETPTLLSPSQIALSKGANKVSASFPSLEGPAIEVSSF
jgi:hypothetical protein